jgi:hypothetical protein
VSAYRETGQLNRAQQLENSYRAGFAPARKQDV